MFKKLLDALSGKIESVSKENISVPVELCLKDAELNNYTDYVFEKLEQEKVSRHLIEIIRDSLDINQVLESAANEVGKLLKADRCLITFYDKNSSSFQIKTAYLADKDISPVNHACIVENLSKRWHQNIVINKTPVIINNRNSDFINKNQLKCFKNGCIKSLIIVPLINNAEIIGSICIQHVKSEKEWKLNQIEFLKATANQIAIAIHQAELYSLVQKQAENEVKIRQIYEKIRSSLNFSEILESVCKEFTELFDVERTTILKYTDLNTYKEWELLYEYKIDENVKGFYGSSKTEEIAEYWSKLILGNNKTCIAINNIIELDAPPSFIKYYNLIGVKSILVVPVKEGHNLRGMIILSEYKYFREWKEEEKNLLESLTGYIYIVIKQAALLNQVQQSAKLKSKFLANISHELRSPLNTIIGFSDMLFSGNHSEEKQKQYLNNISNSGKHLLTLINNIIDISKIEAGNMEVKYEKFDSDRLIEHSIASMKSLAIQKGISIEFELEKVIIEADPDMFSQILYNLLNNAVKFTNYGGKIKVKSTIDEDKLVVIVEDTGIGIAQEDYDKVFDQFKYMDSSPVRKYSSIGLALAKNFIELHKGSIYFDSEEGKGSKFWFIIPCEKNTNLTGAV